MVIFNFFKRRKKEKEEYKDITTNNSEENEYPKVYRLGEEIKIIHNIDKLAEQLFKEKFAVKDIHSIADNYFTEEKIIHYTDSLFNSIFDENSTFFDEKSEKIIKVLEYKNTHISLLKSKSITLEEFASSLNTLLNLAKGVKFEKLIVALLSLDKKYKAIYWGGNFGDKGIDIKAIKNNGEYELIQCKYRDIFANIYPFTIEDTEFINGKIHNANDDNEQESIIFITNSFFNSGALEQIIKENGKRKKHFKLIGHTELIDWISKTLGKDYNYIYNKYPFENFNCDKCNNKIKINAKYKNKYGTYDYCIYCANSEKILEIKKTEHS